MYDGKYNILECVEYLNRPEKNYQVQNNVYKVYTRYRVTYIVIPRRRENDKSNIIIIHFKDINDTKNVFICYW